MSTPSPSFVHKSFHNNGCVLPANNKNHLMCLQSMEHSAMLSASEVVKSESERWVVLVTIWQSHQHTLHHYSHSSTVFNSLHLVHMMLIWWWCLQDHLSPQWSRAAQSLHSKLWTMLVSSQLFSNKCQHQTSDHQPEILLLLRCQYSEYPPALKAAAISIYNIMFLSAMSTALNTLILVKTVSKHHYGKILTNSQDSKSMEKKKFQIDII